MILQKIEDDLFSEFQIQVYCYRLDLQHPEIGGNKYYKLKYNLEEAKKQGKDTLLTFGGAYSNHIYATAVAGKTCGFRSIGIIRGEEHLPLNPVLQAAQNYGMRFIYMDRLTYRQKNETKVLDDLQKSFGDFYLIPEGGSNSLAVKGCSEVMENIALDWDYVCTACGTGGTLAGLTAGLKAGQKALGFAVLKGGDFLNQTVEGLLADFQKSENIFVDTQGKFSIFTEYHFGGYAKEKPELAEFIRCFQARHPIPLDSIYTGKMFYGIDNLIRKGYFEVGKTIIALHTGREIE